MESVIALFFVVRYFMSILVSIILMGKRELIALLNLSSWCLVMVEQLFLAVPWGCLQFLIVVFILAYYFQHLSGLISILYLQICISTFIWFNIYPLNPGIQFRLPCTPPGQFFMGAKLFIGTPWMGNEGVLKKILVWAM